MACAAWRSLVRESGCVYLPSISSTGVMMGAGAGGIGEAIRAAAAAGVGGFGVVATCARVRAS
ncbi:hypothetical protein GGR56DRAFT_645891 [Xylariaceae sp. FL0804]|nr:hypothetical protein GGR56DRAFT_645891 [Xylariaceae sp. FL0804]